MYPRQLMLDHHSETLDNLTGLLQSGLDATHKALDIGLKISREQLCYPYEWSLAVAEGQAPRQVSELASAHVRGSTHLFTEQYAEMVRFFEAQLHVLSNSAHKVLDHIQYWAPREIESTLLSIDRVVDAAEASADQIADTSVEIVRNMGDELETQQPRPRSSRRSRAA